MFLPLAALTLSKSRRLFWDGESHDLASTNTKPNKEMEFVFGEAPPTSLTGSSESQPVFHNSNCWKDGTSNKKSKQTHGSVKGEARMVDVSNKDISKRVATASCKVILGKEVYDLVSAKQIPKGDVLAVAKIAGRKGAKQTSNLIPLCHNTELTHVRVDLKLNPDNYYVEIEGEVEAMEAGKTGKAGVEMEAMTAVTIAGLTVYDMCKAASKDIQITDVRLERLENKVGGKSVWNTKLEGRAFGTQSRWKGWPWGV